MSENVQRYALPQIMKTPECAALYTFLRAHDGQPVNIDGKDVNRLSGLAVQLLVCAQQIWRARGVTFQLLSPSDALCRSLALAGFADIADGQEVQS